VRSPPSVEPAEVSTLRGMQGKLLAFRVIDDVGGEFE
jgi:hypothetical protein